VSLKSERGMKVWNQPPCRGYDLEGGEVIVEEKWGLERFMRETEEKRDLWSIEYQ
jgi:hypothetical protein